MSSKTVSNKSPAANKAKVAKSLPSKASHSTVATTRELNGPQGPEPTRYGDWEKNGRVSDF